MTVQEQ